MAVNTNNVRIPVIPLATEHISLSENRELICDYTNAKLYIKNGEDVVDITTTIKNTFIQEGIPINNCTISVEGMGIINISNAMSHIINNLVNITDIGDAGSQIVSGYNIDLMSITNKNKKLQICGFDTADSGTVPIKTGNSIRWEKVSGSDESETSVYDVEANNSIIQLLNKSVQHTINLESESTLTVLMPAISSQYFRSKWRLVTKNNDLTMNFSPNVSWEYKEQSDKIDKESIYIFSFETWDYGITWYANYTKFTNPVYEEVIYEAIAPRVYSKDEVNTLMSWIVGLEQT